MDNTDFLLFTNGSYLRGPHGKCQAGYVLFLQCQSLKMVPYLMFLPQQAELIALTRACQLAKGKSANTYTDSR